MTLFDFFMEKAAVKLNYWTWESGTIPIQNYIAWFVLGFVFSILGLKLGLFKTKITSKAVHLYIAQLIYFLMVTFK
jgi:putative membrane protein